MSPRTTKWLAWTLWVTSVVLIAFTLLLDFLAPPRFVGEDDSTLLDTLFAVLSVVYVTVGALVASRRPQNPIGWIFCGTGLIVISFQGFALSYATYALGVGYGSLPGGEYMAWVSEWVAAPIAVLATVLLLLLFPDGRLASRGWLIVVAIAVSGSLMLAVGDALAPGPLEVLSVENPLEIGGAVGDFMAAVYGIGLYLAPTSVFLAAISLIIRLIRARGEERQQLMWFAFAAVMMIGGFSVALVAFLLPFSYWINEIGWFLGFLGFFFFPIAVGIAILRYRLYDIDFIINRALVYGALTVSLAVVYFGGVVGLQRLFSPLTGGSNQLATVASTLVIAALFSPLRRRIQVVVDRRFYRRKYDAAKTLEAYSAKLRDETNLDALGDDILTVVRDTMQPEHISLWLKPAADHGDDRSKFIEETME